MSEVKKELLDLQERFVDFMGRAQCDSCRHYRRMGKCHAFPLGIPTDVITNAVMHDEVIEGQKGEFIWEPKRVTEVRIKSPRKWIVDDSEETTLDWSLEVKEQ